MLNAERHSNQNKLSGDSTCILHNLFGGILFQEGTEAHFLASQLKVNVEGTVNYVCDTDGCTSTLTLQNYRLLCTQSGHAQPLLVFLFALQGSHDMKKT